MLDENRSPFIDGAKCTQGRLEARRARGAGTGAGPFSPSAREVGTTAGAAGALTTHAWAMEGQGPLMAPAEHPAPGEGLQLEVGQSRWACVCVSIRRYACTHRHCGLLGLLGLTGWL
jgi:hypothetical protein